MKPIQMPPIAEREKLMQTPTEALVEIILRQQEIIQQLVEEVERLKTNASREASQFVLTAIKRPSEIFYNPCQTE